MKILIDNKLVEYQDDLCNNDGKISFVTGEKIKISPSVAYIVPGFIDRHTHGGYGVDFMDGNLEGNNELLKQLPKEGITSVFPTTMSMAYPTIEAAIDNVYKNNGDGCNVLGIHLEGPFLNLKKVGAQNPKFLKMPDVEFVEKYQQQLKLISYAPELDLDLSFLSVLNQYNIVGSIVHSAATYQQIKPAYQHGLRNFSHFYNGCSGFNHRIPGVVNAGLALSDVYLELICDGIHVDPDVIKYTYDTKNNTDIILITDSMRAKGLEDGNYMLGGQQVLLHDGSVRLANGSLAGSVLKMNIAVKNFHKFTSCPIEDAFLAASYNVCQAMNIKNKGLIREDYDFDIVMLDADFNVIETYINGKCNYICK